MARKCVERNISYDDVRKKFYVNLDFGFGTNGKQIKKTQTFSTITEARKALRAHEVKKDRGEVVQPRQTTVADWLRYWLENIVRPYRAEATVYGYRKIIWYHVWVKSSSRPSHHKKFSAIIPIC